MAGQWFVKFFIPAYKGTTQRTIKVYVPRLATAAARLVAAQKIVCRCREEWLCAESSEKEAWLFGAVAVLV